MGGGGTALAGVLAGALLRQPDEVQIQDPIWIRDMHSWIRDPTWILDMYIRIQDLRFRLCVKIQIHDGRQARGRWCAARGGVHARTH